MTEIQPTRELTWSEDLVGLINPRALPEETVDRICMRVAARMGGEAGLWVGPSEASLALVALQTASGPAPEALRAERARPENHALLIELLSGRRERWPDGSAVAGVNVDAPGVRGALLVLREPGRPFAEEELRWLGLIGEYLSASLRMMRLLAEERRQREKAELMFQASKAIHVEPHFDDAVREIALLTKQALKVGWVAAFEWSVAEEAFRLEASSADPLVDERFQNESLPLRAWPGLAEGLAETEDPERPPLLRLPVPAALTEAYALADEPLCLVPMHHKGQLQGLLALVLRPETPGFTRESHEVAGAMADLLALAMANQHLVDQEARARTQTIRAQAAMQERESLLRQVVHDLRNATQAMSLVVEDLDLASDSAPAIKPSLRVLDSQVTFISNFLKEKLLWLQAGAEAEAAQAAPMRTVFAELERRFAPVARARGLALSVSIPEDVEAAVSTVTMIQILGNLVDNALKYTPARGEVRLWLEYSDGWVTSYVADDGPGIPEVEQARIGEAGFRGDPSHPDGVGLGLANVRQLVTRSGGLFGFASTPGHGTTFHVSIPAVQWGRPPRERA